MYLSRIIVEMFCNCLARLYTKLGHVQVQKISFLAISSRAWSNRSRRPPGLPTTCQDWQ